MVTAGWISQAIAVAAALRLPDALSSGPLTAAEVAEQAKLAPDVVSRLLRVLASEGLLSQHRDGRFALTSLGEVLVSDHPGSVRDLVVFCGAEWHRALGQLQQAATGGACAFEQLYGLPFFDYLSTRPELQRSFNDGMCAVSSLADATVLLAYDFSRVARVVDVGGGTGSLLVALLARHAQLRGVLFDLEPVCIQAKARWSGSLYAERMTFVSGDFRDELPGGADLYLLKTVLHDWSDRDALLILSRCRAAMREGSRLLIIEHVLEATPRAQFAQRLDLLMLAVLGGKERTLAEYERLLEGAGLRLLGQYPSLSELTLLEAWPMC